MKRTLGGVFAVVLFLMGANRLPAPIVEPEEKPTPAAEESEAPKRKHSTKPKTSSSDTEQAKAQSSPSSAPARSLPSGPAKFAGTWAGRINQGIIGNIQIRLVVDANATSVTDSSNFGGAKHAATINGTILEWHAGLFKEVAWTLTPNLDGETAAVTSKSVLGVNGSATFSRSQGAESKITAVAPTRIEAQPTAAPASTSSIVQQTEFPTAKPVPGKPGFVFNPFDPSSKVYLDVRGIAPGTKVKIPSSGKSFIVP